jgi:peptidoglycan/LPS O-acetylase OafA/YrhL
VTDSHPHAATTRRRKLYELEVVRVLTFACVIAVHVVSHTAAGSVPLIASLILLHFTREVFFALTGFVLTFGYLRHPRPMRKFWPRRFLLVGVPYLVWTFIYCVVSQIGHPFDLGAFLAHLGLAALTGTAYYHLYFLLVTMQIYLLFPLLIRLVILTRRWHWLVLVIAFAVQLTTSGLDAYAPGSLHWLNIVSNVIDYQAFIIGGAIAADHVTAVMAFVRTHRRGIAIATVASAAITVAVYYVQLAVGFSASRAATAYQPVVILWSVVAGVALMALGAWWVDRRPDAHHRTLDYLSDRSFGVFLAHPLVLWALLGIVGGFVSGWPPVLVALAAYPIVALGALAIADGARRSILSLPLAGRPHTARLKNIP